MPSCRLCGEDDIAEENETEKSSACHAYPLSGSIQGIKTCDSLSAEVNLGKGAAIPTVVRI